MITRFPTDRLTDVKQAKRVVDKLCYSVENIDNCYFDPMGKEIVIEHPEEEHAGHLRSVVERLLVLEGNQRALPPKTIRSNLTDKSVPPGCDGVEEVFSPRNNIIRGSAIRLYRAINERVDELAAGHTAEARKYGSLIPIDTLQRCGYIRSFPQNLLLVSEFPHELDALEQVKEDKDWSGAARVSRNALSTATCLHCYRELADSVVRTPMVLSADASCFRHEASWRLSDYRLQQFQMREIVVIGEPAYVEAVRQQLIDQVWNLFCEMGLLGKIESASDLFYYSEDISKSQHQMMSSLKYELVASVREGTEAISIASFNNVRDSLVNAFGIADPERPVLHSGCIAFGIDRWVYVLLSMYGTDPERWPGKLRSILQM